MKWSRAGDRGLLLDLGDVTSGQLHGAASGLRRALCPAAVIAGHSSLLFLFETEAPDPSSIQMADAIDEGPTRVVEIGVSFEEKDALDLPEILRFLQISKSKFVDTLLATTPHVRFLGFLPGFAYLDGLPIEWQVPRRATSRQRVPAGSFALAAGMAGFYPHDSPGGWSVVGRSADRFWDESRAEPALLRPGDLLSLREGALPAEFPLPPAAVRERGTGMPIATCLAPGQRTHVVSQARMQRYEYGLAAGGPFDSLAAARANWAAGNEASAAVLECTLVGPELQFEAHCSLAWEGAAVAWERNGQRVDSSKMEVGPGDKLRVGRLTGGLRGWLAFGGGGLESAAVFAMTPPTLKKSELLRRDTSRETITAGAAPSLEPAPRDPRGTIRVIEGPHELGKRDFAALLEQEWIVTPALDRVGIRLHPAGEVVTAPSALPSIGMQFGSVQLHPNGELVVMGPDHPVTGGYLQPITVSSSERWKLAQLQPGDRLRWRL